MLPGRLRERGITSVAGRKEVVWDEPCLAQVAAEGGGTGPSLLSSLWLHAAHPKIPNSTAKSS